MCRHLIETFDVGYHQSADDSQIYVDLSATGAASTMSQRAARKATVHHCFLLNGLKLNASKSESMKLGTVARLHSVEAIVRTVDVVGTSLPLTNERNTQDVIFDI